MIDRRVQGLEGDGDGLWGDENMERRRWIRASLMLMDAELYGA